VHCSLVATAGAVEQPERDLQRPDGPGTDSSQPTRDDVLQSVSNAPRPANITTNPDGSKVVVFECVRTTLPAPPLTTPSQSYSYRTDPELVQALQTAGAYCRQYGSQPMTSSIVTNPDRTKTVTFQCGPR
jgi:hypothetical protein